MIAVRPMLYLMPPTARFHPGTVRTTEGACELPDALRCILFMRHVSGDWGDLDPEDKAENAVALVTGDRILSAYDVAPFGKVYIITEATPDFEPLDREITTVLLADEY